jgi:epoxyqueuosine reductase
VKKLTLEDWERKYIAGPVSEFDQKNTMFMRVAWDETVNGKLDDWSFTGVPKDKAGYTQQDLAFRWAARHGVNMGLFNISKPNVAPLNQAISDVLNNPQYGGRFTRYRSPDGAKVDVKDPEIMTRDIKKAAKFFGAGIVGVCKLDRRFVYSSSYLGGKNEIPEEYKYAIVMGYEEDYDILGHYPTYIADAATSMGYSQMAITNSYLSEFIRGMGYKAMDCTTNDVALSIPLAMQAGLGDIARNGLLVTPEYGPRLRLSKVFTDLPLVADQPIDFGVTELCDVCKKCAKLCPSQSISDGDRTPEPNNASNVSGTLKWPINAETCRMYWGRMSKPCTACVTVCPFNKVMTGWFHKVVGWCVDHVRWADSLYVKLDDWFGYGKPKNADDFWENWRPDVDH